MTDVVRSIQSFNAWRDPDRLQLKMAKMRTSPFIFLRGTCHVFYDQLPDADVFRNAPNAWVCGDLHLENFGSYKGDNRLVYFDMNDFDEACLAPVSWELVRFLTSVLLGMRDLKVERADQLMMCHAFLDAYAAALTEGKARWVERETSDGLIKQLLTSLQERSRPKFLDSRTELKGKRRNVRIDGKKALAVTEQQRAEVESFIGAFAATQPDPQFYKVLDVGRRIAGTGSLGVARYIVLVEGKGSPDANYLLDLKQAVPSALVPHLTVRQPNWESEAHRVVSVQRRVQAVSMAFLQAVEMDGKPFILRGLQPSEDRVALDSAREKPKQIGAVLRTMGEVVAWGQLRSSGRNGSAIADELIDFGRRTDWKRPLLEAVDAISAQVESDWKAFSKAYDDGFYRLASV
ncbi:MAG: DUF2252 domain-containing protein [Burkholderiales bacterium]|nr:DUF2252 domain-containing protein [Burkholderiales bacterium]